MQVDIGFQPDTIRSILFFNLYNTIDFLRVIYNYPSSCAYASHYVDYVRNALASMITIIQT